MPISLVGALFTGLKDLALIIRLGKDFKQLSKWLADRSLPTTRGRHLRELRKRLGSMPFIYKDAEGVLISDYVPAALREVDLISLELYKRKSPDQPSDYEQRKATEALRYESRALLLADAGMGKTTFLSYIAVALTFRTASAENLFGQRRPIPVFIPLKILDNSLQRPVLAYIRSLPLFRGRPGFARLIKLAKQGELLLLLDGYDEIYISSESGSYIRREIDSLLLASLEELPGDEPTMSSLTEFYRALPASKVWLSSRREHYLANRLRIDLETSSRSNRPPLAAVEILGLQSRAELVKKIFDRYRKKSEKLAAELSEDAFFAYISRKLDDEVTNLSDSPLFLTVMCYLYVKGVEQQRLEESAEALNLRTLVRACIWLLLNDLDEFKVRNLPNKLRRALAEKRGLYAEKKFDLLCYFAAQLLGNPEFVGRTAFTEDVIRQIARDFVSRIPADQEAIEIKRNLDTNDVRSIVRQLILQGILVLVDSSGEGEFYDFPHRRFREVLAAEYFEPLERFDEFLGNLGRPHYREFALVMFRLSSDKRDLILEELLRRTTRDESRYYIELAEACLSERPDGYDPTKVIENWIRQVAETGLFNLLSPELVKFVAPSPQFIKSVERCFTKAIETVNEQESNFYGYLMMALQPASFESTISYLLRNGTRNQEMLASKTLLRLDGDQFGSRLLSLNAESDEFRTMATTLIGANTVTGREQWFRRMCRSLSDEQLAILVARAQRGRSILAPRLLGLLRVDRLPNFSDVEVNSGVFVVGDSTSELIDSARERAILLKINEGIYRDASFVSQIPSPSFQEAASELYDQWLSEERARIVSETTYSKINKDEAAIQKSLLREMTLARFVETHQREIESRRGIAHKRSLDSIQKFVQRNMFWPASRWHRFVDKVESTTRDLEEVPKESKKKRVKGPTADPSP